jgi:acetolactate synthase I/II/III large subunit
VTENLQKSRSVVGVIAERLAAAGVRRVFGIPGGKSNLDLIEAFGDADIEWILTHSETAAAFMACATAEVSGVPGVAVVGNGPGLTSIVNGVAQAHLDRVPLIVISDRFTAAEAATTGHEVLDQTAVLDPLVKFSARLDPGNVAAVMEAALTEVLNSPCGPVHIDIPRDVATKIVAGRGVPRATTPASDRFAAAVPDNVTRKLSKMTRPVILVGLEANLSVVPSDLVELVWRLRAAVLTTHKAKGVYPETDSRWAGIVVDGALERTLLRGAEIITIGLDPVELIAGPWPYGIPVLSISESELPVAYLPAHDRSVGTIGARVREILAEFPEELPIRGVPEEEISVMREAMLDSLRADQDDDLLAWRIVETVVEEIPSTVTVTVDAGTHVSAAACLVHPTGPRRFLMSKGLSTVGYAVPAAVAAALERPGEIVVAFTGNGGMSYHGSELETSFRTGARIIVIVFHDSGLRAGRIKAGARRYERDALDYRPTRCDLWAEAMGVAGSRVTTLDELAPTVRDALAAPTSTVIDVDITGNE